MDVRGEDTKDGYDGKIGISPIGRPRKRWMVSGQTRRNIEGEELESAGAGQERMESHNWEGHGPISAVAP
jgi:hypothetical protein